MIEEQRLILAALAGVVTADAPALTALSVVDVAPRALAAILDALPRNTHLRALTCGTSLLEQPLTEGFASRHLLPAVRACGSLRRLTVRMGRNDEAPAPESVAAAVALVAARSSAAAS